MEKVFIIVGILAAVALVVVAILACTTGGEDY